MNEQQLKDLISLVNQNSWTHNKNGVDKVGKLVQTLLSDIPLQWESFSSKDKGDLLFAKSKAWNKNLPRILLVSHLDTVFEKNWNIHIADNKFYGPGTLDMKAGVLVIIELIKRLYQTGELTNLQILFTPDEEDGMAHLKNQKRIYNNSDYALVFEEGVWNHSNPSPKERAAVIERKALSFFEVFFNGPGGHNATVVKRGERHSAVREMARVIEELESLTDFKEGTFVNVGLASGGISPNAIPENAEIKVDIRYGNSVEEKRIRKILPKIFKPHDAKLEIKYDETLYYPSFETTPTVERFAELVIDTGKELNLSIKKQKRSSGSEANWIASTNKNCAVLDGFGVIGKGDHSSNEFFFLDSFTQSLELSYYVIRKLCKIPYD